MQYSVMIGNNCRFERFFLYPSSTFCVSHKFMSFDGRFFLGFLPMLLSCSLRNNTISGRTDERLVKKIIQKCSFDIHRIDRQLSRMKIPKRSKTNKFVHVVYCCVHYYYFSSQAKIIRKLSQLSAKKHRYRIDTFTYDNTVPNNSGLAAVKFNDVTYTTGLGNVIRTKISRRAYTTTVCIKYNNYAPLYRINSCVRGNDNNSNNNYNNIITKIIIVITTRERWERPRFVALSARQQLCDAHSHGINRTALRFFIYLFFFTTVRRHCTASVYLENTKQISF